MGIVTQNKSIANKLLDDSVFTRNNLQIFIPFHLYSKQYVVRNISLETNTREIVEFGEINGNIKILHARRLNRKISKDEKIEYVPSTTILLTIDSTILPRHLHLELIRYDIEPYKAKPRQCFNCFKFGHLKKTCRAILVCL